MSYGLWVTMMHQGEFINCDKCTALVGDAEPAWGQDIRELSVLSVHFVVNLKLLYK